jgi:vitamin B12 transporter
VLTGAHSAVYGSNAIAGVVDITTWRPERLGFSGIASVEGGTWDTYSGTLNLGQMTERGEVALTYSRVTTHGFSARIGDDEDDGFDQTSLALSAAYDMTDALRLGFSTIYSDSTTEFDRSEFDPTGETDETRKGARLYADFTIGSVDNEIAASVMESELYDEGGFTERFIGARRKLEYQGSAELNAAATLAFGADWTEEEAKLDGTRYDADSSAVFGEVQYAASDALDLSLSLRYDSYSDFDDQLSGRVGMAWRLQDDLILRAIAGTGYRAPSLYERFGPYTAPDADLQPEESRSAEIGIEKIFGAGSFAKATLFWSEIDDLIDYDFAAGGYAQVPGTTTSQGVELSGRYALTGAVALFGNYTYTDASNDEGRLVRVPRHDANIGVEGSFSDRFKGQLALQYVADRTDIGTYPNPPSELDDYTLVNATLSYALTDATEAYLRVENLTDEEYEPVRGYNGAGRAMYVGLRASF